MGRFSSRWRYKIKMLIRNVKESDWQAIHQIEAANFSKEEAISKEAIQERIKCIPDTFLVTEINDDIVGYIEGPIVQDPVLTDNLFHKVEKNPIKGGYLAITSLSIKATYQKQGIGTALLAALKDLVLFQERQGILLTCHDYLIAYYEMNGFTYQGPSESKHGGGLWHDMLWKVPTL